MSEKKDMEHEHCLKEGDLATLKAELKDLNKIVKGNGQKGMQQVVTELNTNVPKLTTSVDILSGQMKELLDRKVASDTERAIELSAKQKMTAIITGIVGVATVIIMLAEMYMRYKVG